MNSQYLTLSARTENKEKEKEMILHKAKTAEKENNF
jgi:hypothetical protein